MPGKAGGPTPFRCPPMSAERWSSICGRVHPRWRSRRRTRRRALPVMHDGSGSFGASLYGWEASTRPRRGDPTRADPRRLPAGQTSPALPSPGPTAVGRRPAAPKRMAHRGDVRPDRLALPRGEAFGLDFEDFDTCRLVLEVHGKLDRQRLVPVHPSTAEKISQYCQGRTNGPLLEG